MFVYVLYYCIIVLTSPKIIHLIGTGKWWRSLRTGGCFAVFANFVKTCTENAQKTTANNAENKQGDKLGNPTICAASVPGDYHINEEGRTQVIRKRKGDTPQKPESSFKRDAPVIEQTKQTVEKKKRSGKKNP